MPLAKVSQHAATRKHQEQRSANAAAKSSAGRNAKEGGEAANEAHEMPTTSGKLAIHPFSIHRSLLNMIKILLNP